MSIKNGERTFLTTALDQINESFAIRGSDVISAQSIDFTEKFLNELNEYGVLVSDYQGVKVSDLDYFKGDSTTFRTLLVAGNVNTRNNVFIDSLAISFNQDDFTQQRISMFFNVSDYGDEGSVVVRLKDQERQLSSLVRSINEIGHVDFDIPLSANGLFSVEIEGDDVFYDDRFLFVIGERKKVNVVLIEGRSNSYLREVFANSSLFNFNYFNTGSIDFELTNSADVIVLNEIKSIPSGLLSQFLDKTLLIFPDLSEGEAIANLLEMDMSQNTIKDQFEVDIDYSHPIFKGVFEKSNDQSLLPRSTTLYDISGSFESIISLRNGDPLLVKIPRKNYYYFNTVLEDSYSSIGSHSIFLPLIYQLTLSSVHNESNPYYYPGELIQLDVTNSEIPPVITGNGIEIIPEFNPTGTGIIAKVPENLKSGFYTIIHDQDTIREIAINVPKDESLMEGLSYEELKTFFDNTNHVSVKRIDDNSLLAMAENETSIRKYALILILFLILTETLLHRYLK